MLSLLVSCTECGRRDEALCGEKESLEYARNIEITDCGWGAEVTLRDPWDTLRTRQRYYLVNRGSELPDGLADGIVIRVPVERAAVYASVHASMIEELGCLDRVCAVCEPQYMISEEVRRRVADGTIADLGMSTSPNVEKMVDLEADVIIASPFENSSYGAAEKIGVPIVEAADYMESHPLGRTEWVRFYGLLLGKKEMADSLFSVAAARYNELKEKISAVGTRPSVVLETKYGSSWAVPSGNSYIGVLHSDAGADYLFADETSASPRELSFEAVYDRACDADFWLFKGYYTDMDSREDLAALYPPYANFRAFREGRIYYCNTMLNNYYDEVTLHPDRILSDLAAIYHPELLPDYRLRYYSLLK